MSNALKTDMYELTMLNSFVASGKAEEHAVFEVFTRRLPEGRRYGVFAGLGRLLPMLKDFVFHGGYIQYLTNEGIINAKTAEWLAGRAWEGPKVQIDAYPEGELFFPHSPVMTISGALGDCILMETLVLSVLNFDSAIATTAARMVSSAQGKSIIEMGSRRTNEDAAVAAARAAYIAGFDATSNLQAGYTYGIPTKGTAAHAFILAHGSEREAFEKQMAVYGPSTTFLVDTYDIRQGIKTAVEVCGTSQPGAVRIDSGDLVYEVHAARQLLDDLGAYMTKILVSSDLDEHIIKDLRDAPVDAYGVGTKLVSSAPIGFVYKLVEISGRSVTKKAKDKVSVGGRKKAWREYEDGKIVAEYTTPFLDIHDGSPVQTFHMEIMPQPSLNETRRYHKQVKDTLPIGEQAVWYGDHGPYITTEHKGPRW